MTDYGRPLSFGVFITPSARSAQQVVALARLAERTGLDLVTFQDHPYQPSFLDTWTLLSYVAARTESVRLSGNVLNLPLREPTVLARSVASLDLLSGGRVELGLGAGAFWDAIEAMGGTRLAPAEAVTALTEAIRIIREIWDVDTRGGVRLDGTRYRVAGAKRGPAPAHPVQIWLGAYKPRMLRLVGRLADGWLPSEGYLSDGDLTRGNAAIDEAAIDAGRQPEEIRRLLNLNPPGGADQLAGWSERLVELALTEGVDTFIVPADDADSIEAFAAEVVPAVRTAVESERAAATDASVDTSAGAVRLDASGPGGSSGSEPPDALRRRDDGLDHDPAADEQWERLGLRPNAAPAPLADRQLWDESERPRRRPSGTQVHYSARGRAVGQHLIEVHDHLRSELTTVRDILSQVRDGTVEAAAARSVINDLTVRQNDWTLGAYCASYCRLVAGHHTLEDTSIFPHLRRSETELAPVLDRLSAEHHVIHEVLELLDQRLVAFIGEPEDFTGLQDAVDVLSDTLLSHLAYEEDQLVEPLARLGFYANQV